MTEPKYATRDAALRRAAKRRAVARMIRNRRNEYNALFDQEFRKLLAEQRDAK